MRDTAATEIIGFMAILVLVIASITVVTALWLPIYIEETETTGNEEALDAFLSFSRDISALCLSGDVGASRKSALPEAVRFQERQLSLSYEAGTNMQTKDGTLYRAMVLTYAIKNTIADDFTISLSNRGIRKNNAPFIPASILFAVNPDDTAEQMESDSGTFWIEYTYLGNLTHEGRTYHILSVRLA